MGLIGAEAQNLRNASAPAETPPAAFKGKQYVDSRGCVFIRAGHSGRVTWVPRVTRDRKQICNARPSVAPKVASATPRTKGKVVRGKPPKNAQVISRTVKVVKPKAAPKPTATRVVRKAAAAAPKAKTQTRTRVVRQQPKAQQRVVRRQAAAAQQPQRQVQRQPKAAARCAGASDFSAQFINKGARCGPQTGAARSVVSEELSPQSRNTSGAQRNSPRTGPKGVNRKIAQARMPAPKGYKRAWKDDRLNPLRGVGTTSGKGQMNLVWSKTVPRYLIDPATGKRATARQRRVLGLF